MSDTKDFDIKNDDDEIVNKNDDDMELTISAEPTKSEWIDSFPGPADRNFDYRKLLETSSNGIGDAKNSDLKVAIIGAGPAGLTAAHELARSGLKNIDLFEASDRYGGRMWTKTLAPDFGEDQYSVMDAGAMRMPVEMGKIPSTIRRRTALPTTLVLDTGIDHDQLWFEQTGDDLLISVIGTSDQITVENWYASADNKIEGIETGDGKVADFSGVEALVSAMASFSPPGGAATDLSDLTYDPLDSVLTTNWQSSV